MRKITQNEFDVSYSLHTLYLKGKENGARMNLENCDLQEINLSGAYLSRANLSEAYLSEAYLSGANLSEAYLSGAYLSGAYLSRANLSRADLSRANLSGANLPSPTEILVANWGELSDSLTAQAMAFDAACHNDPEKFNVWKETGVCPYADSKFQRACNFREKRELWNPNIPVPRIWDLMVAIIREKCANSDFHDKI